MKDTFDEKSAKSSSLARRADDENAAAADLRTTAGLKADPTRAAESRYMPIASDLTIL